MKRIISVFLSIILLLFSVLPAFGAEKPAEEREYFEDGSYITVSVDERPENESTGGIFAKLLDFLRRLIDFFKGQKTVSKTKKLNYYSADDELLWTARLKGEFVYTKNSAVCTLAEFSTEIYDSDWQLVSSSCRETENLAVADFTIRQYKLLVPLKTVERTMKLECDTQGNVK